MPAKTELVPTQHLRILAGFASISLLLAAGASSTAFADLAVSANDNKLVLVNGVPTVVANPRPDTVTIIDLSAKPPRIVNELNVATSVVGPPLSVAITPDESLVLVTGAMRIDPSDPTRQIPDNKLSVIDLRANPPSVVVELNAGLGAAGLSINREGTLALVANRSDGSVSVFKIDGHTVRKIDTVQIGPPDSGVSHVAISPNGRTALVTRDGDNMISVLSINGDRVEYTKRDFGVGLKPYGIVISADGQTAIVAHLGIGRGDNDTISLIDLTLNPPRVTDTYTVGQTPEGITISPDGKLVAVVTMNGSNKAKESPFYSPFGRLLLFRLNRGGLKLIVDAHIGIWPQGAAFSADGKTLLVQSMDERNIMVFSIDDNYRLKDTGQRIPLQGGGAALRTADRPVK
jgi:DNA-binding beta-propeller fold protein YncE